MVDRTDLLRAEFGDRHPILDYYKDWQRFERSGFSETEAVGLLLIRMIRVLQNIQDELVEVQRSASLH